MSIKVYFQRLARKNLPLNVAWRILQNQKQRFKYSRGEIATDSGTIHSDLDLEKSID